MTVTVTASHIAAIDALRYLTDAGVVDVDARTFEPLTGPPTGWSPGAITAVWTEVRRHRRALQRARINVDGLSSPACTTAASRTSPGVHLDPASGDIVLDGTVGITSIAERFAAFAPRALWDGRDQCWRFRPEDTAELAELAAEHSWPVDADCTDVLAAASAARSWRRQQSRALAPSTPVTVPGLNPEVALRSFQVAGIEYMARVRHAMNCDPPGLGKSVMALGAVAVDSALPVLIVCKAKLRLNWAAEVEKWFPAWSSFVVEGRTGPTPPPGTDTVIINYDILHERLDELLEIPFRAAIIDESHYLKEPGPPPAKVDAWREKVAAGATTRRPAGSWRTYAATQVAHAIHGRDGMILELSATPRPNRNRELWPQLEILGLGNRVGGWMKWMTRYADAKQKYGKWDIDGSTNKLELNTVLRGTCMIARRKSEVLPQLPPLMHLGVVLAMAGPARVAYDQARADVVKFLAERARALAAELGDDADKAAWLARLRAASAKEIVELTTLRRLAGLGKVAEIVDWVNDYLTEHPTDEDGRTRKIVMFAHHRDVQAALAAAFAGVWLRSAADQTDLEAETVKHQFQTDPACTVIVCSSAAKEGHTLTAGTDVVLAELPWVGADVTQMAGRCHGRMADVHGANVWYMLASDTIDNAVFNMVLAKTIDSDEVVHGDVVDSEGMTDALVGETAAQALVLDTLWQAAI